MGNYNCTTDRSSSAYSRLGSSHNSHYDDHSLREPLLRNITQRVEEQQQELLHHIYEVNRVKETVKSANTSDPNPIPPPSKPMPMMEQKPNIHHTLESELHQELRLRVYKQGEAIEKLKEKNVTLEKKVLELTETIKKMKRTSASFNENIPAGSGSGSTAQIMSTPIPNLISLQTPVADSSSEIIEEVMSAEYEMKNNSIISELSSMTAVPQSEINYGALNDLTGCLVVLIFLVAVLIGVLL